MMVFFLAQHGISVARFVDDPTVRDTPPIDMPAPVKEPSISAMGFVIDCELKEQHKTFNPLAEEFRIAVLKSFKRIALYIQDTKATLQVKLHITDEDTLLISVPTINHHCSKMHIEDISPIDAKSCNHDDIGCDLAHFADTSALIASDDYVQSSQNDAIFKVHNTILHFARGKKWIRLNIKPGVPDGFYTLNENNF